MARIRYKLDLLDNEQLVTITNADTDWMAHTTSESFTNPPIKMRFLNTGKRDFAELCSRAINDDNIIISHNDIIRMVQGELPGWRLVGAEFSPEHGFSVHYANESRSTSQVFDGKKHDYRNSEGVAFYFLAGDGHLEVELEVDYADGLPARRYVGKVTENEDDEFILEVTEYLGKRKVKKLEFAENDFGSEGCTYLCYVTEY